jgi:hypothetical protein
MYFMGTLRRFLGKLFDPPAPSLEEIVFERIDDVPPPSDSHRQVRVSLEELIPCIPLAWIRSGTWSLQQTIEIPPEAFLEGSAERPAVASLRFLANAYPLIFRDPGLSLPDPGVDLPMMVLRETSSEPVTLPAQMSVESPEQVADFAEWDGDPLPPEQRAVEAREAAAALAGVHLPPPPVEERNLAFEATLAAQPTPSVPESAPSSLRIRKILEAYAEGLPSPFSELPEVAPAPQRRASPAPIEPLPIQTQLARIRSVPPDPGNHLRTSDVPSEVSPPRTPAAAPEPLVAPGPGAVDLAPFRMRFEELGLSLSRFPEVKGFVLWQSGHFSHTGDLGFDLELSALRLRLERLLEGAVQVQGAQDGFSSVTLNHARGGMSVFGSGGSLVAVAHQHDGLPSHLRAWMCGWVSQPLRG